MRRTIAGRTSSRAAAIRRMRWRGRPGRFPVTLPRSARSRPRLSALREHRHDPAEVRRPGRLRLRGRQQAVVLGRRRRHRRHHALRHRSVRHQQRVGHGLREGELLEGRAARRLLHEHPQRRCRPAADARPERRADHVRLRYDDASTSRCRTCRRSRKRHVVSYGGNLRFNSNDLSIAPDADNRTEFGIYGQDEIFLSDQFRLVVGARVDRFDFVDDFVFSPRVAFLIKPRRGPDVPRLVQPGLSLAVGDQQLHRPDHLAARQSALVARRSRVTYLLPVNIVGNHRPRGAVARRLRNRILGRRARTAARLSRRRTT